MSTRTAQKAATRASLREAGRACFLERGFAATSVKHIVSAAGVAHGTFYVHFPGKAELLDELLEEFNQALAGQLVSVLDQPPTRETVRRAAELFLDHWLAHRRLVECFAERSAASLSLANLRDGLNPPVAGLLEQSLAQVSRAAQRDLHAELVTHAMLGLWLRVGLQYLFNERVTREAALDTLVRMSTGALLAVLEP